MHKLLIPKSFTILELFSFIVFMQLCNSISSLNILRKFTNKNRKDKEIGEKLILLFAFSVVQANHAPTVALAGDDGGELQLLCLGDEQGHIVLIEAAEEECGSR